MAPAQHIHHKKVVEAVAIDVREIDAHRGKAHLSNRQRRHGVESPLSIIDPEAIRRLEIVAHVNVRRSVAVDIAEHDREPPVKRRLRQRPPMLVKKRALGERHRYKPSRTLIPQQHIRLPVLVVGESASAGLFADLEIEAIHQFRIRQRFSIHTGNLRRAVDGAEGEAGVGLVPDRDDPIVGNIDIQVSVTVNVRQREGGSGSTCIQRRRLFCETSFPIIQKNPAARSDCVHQQIQITITIQVRQCRSRRVQPLAGHSGFRRDILESPVAQIPQQHVRSIQPAKIQITPSIAIHVSGRHPGTVQQNLVRQMTVLVEEVGKPFSGGLRLHQREPSTPLPERGHLRVTPTSAILPFKGTRSDACSWRKAQEEDSHPCCPHSARIHDKQTDREGWLPGLWCGVWVSAAPGPPPLSGPYFLSSRSASFLSS